MRYRLRLFENRILKRVFGPEKMRMGIEKGSTKRNFIVLYRSPNIVNVINLRLIWAGPVKNEGR